MRKVRLVLVGTQVSLPVTQATRAVSPRAQLVQEKWWRQCLAVCGTLRGAANTFPSQVPPVVAVRSQKLQTVKSAAL